jgi:hypothetical protein
MEINKKKDSEELNRNANLKNQNNMDDQKL